MNVHTCTNTHTNYIHMWDTAHTNKTYNCHYSVYTSPITHGHKLCTTLSTQANPPGTGLKSSRRLYYVSQMKVLALVHPFNTHTSARAYTRTRIHMHAHTHVRTHTRARTHTCAHTHVRAHTQTHHKCKIPGNRMVWEMWWHGL